MITNLCALEAQTFYYILAGVAAAAVVIAAIALLISHKKNKKTADEKVLDSRGLINANVQAVEPLLVLAEGKPAIQQRLKDLQDKIKYLSPSEQKEATAVDKKISNALGDLKIELSKTKDEDKSGKAQKYIDEIELLIAERSAYTER